jgi:cation-transporting ATPase 13A1
VLTPASDSPYAVTLTIRRRFQFSSALKRMSTIAALPGGRLVAAVKGAPETIKGMLAEVPRDYDETYKWYTRQGSRVLALGMKEMEGMPAEKVRAFVLCVLGLGVVDTGWMADALVVVD